MKKKLFKWLSKDSLIEVIEKSWERNLIQEDDEILSYIKHELGKRKSELEEKMRESEVISEILNRNDLMLEDCSISVMDADGLGYFEHVKLFLSYGDVLLIVEEREKENEHRVCLEANSVMLSLMFSYFHFEQNQTRGSDEERSD